jgi:hypothetical protein
MVIENQKINLLNLNDLKGKTKFHLFNCLIDEVDFIGGYELNVQLKIEKCIINEFNIHSCWFDEGLILKNNVILSYVDYQMGGHNDKPIVIEGNVFTEFVNFFDCQFASLIEVKNNVFIKGSNLLGNQGEGYQNSFKNGFVVENNSGSINLNET